MVHYGKDRVSGFFISITDDRLCGDRTFAGIDTKVLDSDVLGKIAGMPDGDSGHYLQAHTGPSGFGHKINVTTMKYLWKQYDASDEDMKIFSTGHEGVIGC